MAIAAAMQIGMGGIASAADGESLGIAAAALDGDNLKVDVLYTCPAGAKHKMLAVLVEELDKDGKVVAKNVGTAKLVVTDYDDEKKENVEKPGCDGEPQRLTVTVEPDDEMKWTKGAMGNVTVSFTDDIEFNAKQSNLKFVAE
ncbi:hypothetical protein AB0M22_00560 [Nocardia sp. NPDC051756]|uniref:hypothetical protein n=1 Tax=Nocardia sp. NPDC051756 TaxID=3154751 RepID=UPI003413A2D8